MAILDGVSIRWKLSVALILTGLVLIGSYVWLAKNIFESDKIAYVFEAQATRLQPLADQFSGVIQRTIFNANAIAFSAGRSGSLGPVGKRMFDEDPFLLKLEVRELHSNRLLLSVMKADAPLIKDFPDSSGQLMLIHIDRSLYSLMIRPDVQGPGAAVVYAVLDLGSVLPVGSPTQSLALVLNKKVVYTSDSQNLGMEVFSQLASNVDAERPSSSTDVVQRRRYLVSSVPLGVNGWNIVGVTPEQVALGALNELFRRSVIFLVMSGFALVIVSLTLARGLTTNLARLSEIAGEIGKGHFDIPIPVRSRDEMGVLARAFQKMSSEIKRLIEETKEKARMEQELKTASLVQDRLMPLAKTQKIGRVEVSGTVQTSSECGGDWWYYFTNKNRMYLAVADATGHGTPAALITASARSIFSSFEFESLTLGQMMEAWDRAVASCSGQQVYMTGVLIEIDCETGTLEFLNAAHDPPFIFRKPISGKTVVEPVAFAPSSRIGDGAATSAQSFRTQLQPGEQLLLYSDGLFAIERSDGVSLSPKRFMNRIAAKFEFLKSAVELTDLAFGTFNEFRGDLPLPDDVCVVSIRYI